MTAQTIITQPRPPGNSCWPTDNDERNGENCHESEDWRHGPETSPLGAASGRADFWLLAHHRKLVPVLVAGR